MRVIPFGSQILSKCNRGDVVFLPRIRLVTSEVNLPFVLNSSQFPLIPAYTMTINKSQGKLSIMLEFTSISLPFHMESSVLYFQGLGIQITLKFTQRHLKYKENY
ncbi:hypothetical protein AVEN_45120-1 [Araneus ventricosus]|uniref:Uncharacterized protein n=1 Tax=Araneus ventricosus TaxID=182803 RepID=A0A4Y2MJJ8_ARAVE|nr:hypothetical protein AVEN_45120-1 [Araneus ventricosus]